MGTHKPMRFSCPGEQRKFEIPRHHPDHHIRFAIEQDLGAQNLPVSMEPILPGRITQNSDLLAMFILVGGKHTPQQRCDTESGKYSRGQTRGVHASGLTGTGKLIRSKDVSAQSSEGPGFAGIGADIGHGDPDTAIATYIHSLQAVRKHHQPVRIGKGQGPQQNAFHDRENRRGRSNSEGQHQDCRHREAWGLAQLADDELQIEKKRTHVPPRSTLPATVHRHSLPHTQSNSTEPRAIVFEFVAWCPQTDTNSWA